MLLFIFGAMFGALIGMCLSALLYIGSEDEK